MRWQRKLVVTGGEAGAVAFVKKSVDGTSSELEVVSIVGGVEEAKFSSISKSSC